jgi:hypothetical protein
MLGDIQKLMVRTAVNQKISIMLVLSITILAAVLVTGAVEDIVSAAGIIKVHANTKQHPVTSTGNAHIVSAAGIIKVHANTKQHPVTSTGNPPPTLSCLDEPEGKCPTQLFVFSAPPDDTPYWFGFAGELVDIYHPNKVIPISGAPIHFSARYVDDTVSHPHPFTFTDPAGGPQPVKTEDSGWFIHFTTPFYACEKPEYRAYNHDAILTAHFDGGTYYAPSTGQLIILQKTTSPDTGNKLGTPVFTTVPCPSQHTPLSHPVITPKVMQRFQKIIASTNRMDHSAK